MFPPYLGYCIIKIVNFRKIFLVFVLFVFSKKEQDRFDPVLICFVFYKT
ncbi:hypothetical protein CU035_1257 [Enterococcus faecium]|nr:hypothetical protein HMPREF1382_00247 [Enterococcus faecium S447]MBK4755114.1 hypothetical protein [Enterococcus faecium]MBK4793064.1 hypothetical protein [Enterococcus faecium]MBK4803671.1 hypothetical protein [Enterococcus faecium]MBK4816757.1 hypothetical protein [Enterococcus faecium]